ncbi:MAG: replicative DNA helicase [Eubacteriales bacterium]|nr:replicative DNA helicase [Eubacteriales bacterium]
MAMDDLLARQLPQAIEAEQAVIGSMLIDPSCIPEVIELLRPEDFYAEENRRIFETVYEMFTDSARIDAVTVLNELKVKGEYDDAGGRAYLSQLMDVTPTAAGVREYARIIRDKSMLREVAAAGADIQAMAYEGAGEAGDIAEAAEQKIYAVRHGREVQGLAPINSIILDVYNRLDELAQSESGLPGLPTGFHDLDRRLTGLNKSDLILIAARPGMGKTAFALNVALYAAKHTDKDVVLFQLEMSRDQLASRLLSQEAVIDSQKLKTGELEPDDWTKIARAANTLAKTHIYVDDNPAITVAEIKAKCRRLGDNLGLIVIDYLQLMQSGKRNESRVNEIGEISRAMKIMAKELNVPVICLSQLSRAVEKREDKRPMLSDLRESGAIEQDADIVLFIYRDEYYDNESEEKNNAEIIIAKNRHGATGSVMLQWIGQYTTFYNQDRIHE